MHGVKMNTEKLIQLKIKMYIFLLRWSEILIMKKKKKEIGKILNVSDKYI